MKSKIPQNQAPIEIRLVTIDGRAAFSVVETAVMLGVSERHVFTSIKNGEVKAFRLGGRRLISVFEILRLIGHELGSLT